MKGNKHMTNYDVLAHLEHSLDWGADGAVCFVTKTGKIKNISGCLIGKDGTIYLYEQNIGNHRQHNGEPYILVQK